MFVKTIVAIFLGAFLSYSQPPWNIFLSLFFIFPILLILLEKEISQDNFAKRFLKLSYYGGLFLYSYFLFGFSWISSAFEYRIGFDNFQNLTFLGLPLLITILSISGFILPAIFWGKRITNCLSLALALALGEYLRSYLLTGFPWNLFSYALGFNEELMQTNSLFGPHVTSFLLILASFSFLLLFSRASRLSGLVILLILPSMFFFGHLRLMNKAELNEKTFLIIQPNIPQEEKGYGENFPSILQSYIDLSNNGQVDLIIWPESALPILLDENKILIDSIISALPLGTSILTGNVRLTQNGNPRNSALLINEDSNVSSFYDKNHLVPFGEYLPLSKFLKRLKILKVLVDDLGFEKGDNREPMLTPLGVARILICYEIIFPNQIRKKNEKIDLIINLTNDAWFDDGPGPYQHFTSSRFRAVEQGLPVLRSANTGISAIIDPFGRIIDKLNIKDKGYLKSSLPMKITPTLYSKIGDFSLFAVIILYFIFLFVNFRRESPKA